MAARFTHLLPVVLGGDIGAYALARQLHEATGARVSLVASEPIVAISRSSYIDVLALPAGAGDDETIALLRRLVASRGERSAVLMANTDAAAALIASRRDELEPTYVLPFPDIEVLERVSDKASFSRLCAQVEVGTPREVVVDLADPQCQPPTRSAEHGLAFPLVAKAAIGSDYDRVSFPGKRKIWFIDDAEELAGMWQALQRAGYRSPFLLQEHIPGDDTAMRSVTVYMDSTGAMRLVASARVLLQDHAPWLIGNPVAMITEPFPSLWRATERLLAHAGYRGFANLDIKVDPRDGRELFLEVNPRIGRNSFYLTAAGANPMTIMLQDLVADQRGPRTEVTRQVLYSLVPLRLLYRYLRDPGLRHRARVLASTAADPLRDPSERSLRRRVTIELQRLNQYRKFARFYSEPSSHSSTATD
ncbi:carboxylate--amine ligase [Actinomyces bowdenii]|uniref:carboxylate--amine ligase n=1 Tax=Actinomyces bowdenii TaxID=131109 RepID=UPI00214A8BFF|nr:carboxylate--amine ligase [Actinomyces bowdenii]MCR2052222.1 carboxylate--amine ligase [Actinomyces bowdenii]